MPCAPSGVSRSGRRKGANVTALSLPDLQAKAKVVRRHIINSTTAAGSGHPTSSLSATDVAVAL